MYCNKVSPDSPLGITINMCYYHLTKKNPPSFILAILV